MRLLFFCALFFCGVNLFSDGVLRGFVSIAREPVWKIDAALPYPIPEKDAYKTAEENAVNYFSIMIYGCNFYYNIGSASRGAQNIFETEPLGKIVNNVEITDVKINESIFNFASDYNMTDSEATRRKSWESGLIRKITGTGESALQGDIEAALKNAMEDAVRSIARRTERERPRAASGKIALADFPLVTVVGGEWRLRAKFFVDIIAIEYYNLY